MRQPEPNRDSEAFLSALAEQLSAPPGNLATKRHIAAAAATVRAARHAGSRLQWATAAVVVFALLGTGGIAVAGGLPASVQGMVADMARALPVPFEIPYPVATVDDPPARRAPADGEVEVEVFVPTTSLPTTDPAPSTVDEVQPPSHSEFDEDSGDRANDDCVVSDIPEGPGHLNDDDWRELREHLREECGHDLVAPPGFTDGSREDPDGGRDDRSRDDNAEGRGERGDRDSDDDRDRDSDESDERDGDRQEERHHDGDRDDDRGPGDRWGDGRD